MPIHPDVRDAGGKVDPAARWCSVLLVVAEDLFGASLGKFVGLSRRQGRVQQLEAGGADLRILAPGHQPAAPDTKQQLVDRRDRQQHQNQPWQRQCNGDSHDRTLTAPVCCSHSHRKLLQYRVVGDQHRLPTSGRSGSPDADVRHEQDQVPSALLDRFLRVRLTVLGGCGAWPAAGQACSGYLVEQDGFRLLVDLGFATVPRLLERVTANQIDAVFISHGHADDCAELYAFFF